MIIEDLVGMELIHKKYGKVKIIDLDIDYSNIGSTKFKVQLPNRVALFSLNSLLSFFSGVPEDIIKDIEDVLEDKPSTSIYSINKNKKELEHIDFDEFESNLTVDDWKRSKKFVVYFWWISNGFLSPVVMDDEKIFISSKAACKYLGIQETKYYDIYMICNGTNTSKKLEGHSWRFAKGKEIDEIIKNYEQ